MRSKFEEKVAQEMRDKGILFQYESVTLQYTVEHKYTVDFLLPNGILVETKGYFDAQDRAKHIALAKGMQKMHKNQRIRFVFMKANTKIHKKSSMTYGDWATKHGFIWADGSIPDSWYEEKFK